MSTVALLFERAAPASTSLVFGDTGAAAPASEIAISGVFPALTGTIRLVPLAELEVAGTFPALTAQITLVSNVKLNISGSFPALQALAEVTYSSNTSRPTVAQVADKAQVATTTEGGISQPQQHAQPNNSGTQSVFSEAEPISAGRSTGFANGLDASSPVHGRFADAASTSESTRATMQEGDRQWLRFYSQFQEADRVFARLFGRFEDGVKTPSLTREHLFQDAKKTDAPGYTGHASDATPRRKGWQGPFQDGRVPPPGMYVRPVLPVIPTFWWTSDLLFACPPLAFPHLVFGDSCTSVPTGQSFFAILPARFYMTAHTIFAQTLPGLVDVPIFDATVSADAGSYCWTLQASGPASLLEQLAPVAGLPAQIKLTLDGIPWVFAVDSITRAKEFGKSGVRIQGRSLTALIAAPYLRATTRANALDQTAQQIAEDALSGTGIALDWGVGSGALANGGLTDWLVGAGAWSHSGTPLDAVQAIVQAAGGYLQSHRSAATLLARHPYGQRVGDTSGAPWAWSTGNADVELALDAIITEAIERRDGPDINAIYVSGTTQGVLGLVKRSGSAGDKLAAMITDPLITHADAARQRGLSVLGAAGHKYAVSLDLPVLTGIGQPGVLDVGQLVQINAAVPWRARVRGVTVAAKQPTLRQTVMLERHLEIA